MNKNSEIRKNIRPKCESLIKHISQPFDVKHDLHISKETVDNTSDSAGFRHAPKPVDNKSDSARFRNASPPAPCPGQKENSEQALFPDHAISRVIIEEILPAIRYEIGDVIEEKINKILDERNNRIEAVHCASCTCNEVTHPRRDEPVFFDSPRPCKALFLENSDTKSDTNEVNLDTVPDVNLTEGTGEQLQEATFSNPIYHHKAQTLLMQTQNGAKTIRYRADETTIGDDSLNKTENQSTMKGIPLSKSDERECLSNALQSHIHELVDGNVFPDDKLPDDLLVNNCLTEDECESVRKKPNRKDKIRVVLCFIKGRDLDILEKFVRHVRSYDETVANSIEVKFEQNKKDGKRCTTCVFCQLISLVNLKYIVDDLWKCGLINDGLFGMIIQTNKPAGVQTELWNGVIDSINMFSVQSPADVSYTLAEALRKKHHYEHLAKGVEWMIYTNKKLVCICKIRQRPARERLNSSMFSSISSTSSVYDVAVDQNGYTSISTYSTETVNSQEKVQKGIQKDGKVPVDGRLLQDNVFTEDSMSTTVVEKNKPGEYSNIGDKTPEEKVANIAKSNAKSKKGKTKGQPLYTNTDIPKSDDGGMSPPDVRKPKGSNSVVTKSMDATDVVTGKTTSASSNRPRPPRRPAVPKKNPAIEENCEILHV